jgi:sorting nexin-25
MIGRSNARRGARRIFAVLQNRRLNQHIAYTIIDEVSVGILFDRRLMDLFSDYEQVFSALFPEAVGNP